MSGIRGGANPSGRPPRGPARDRLIEEAVVALVCGAHDPEACHGDADEVLLKALRDLGAGEVADAYIRLRTEVGFWYA